MGPNPGTYGVSIERSIGRSAFAPESSDQETETAVISPCELSVSEECGSAKASLTVVKHESRVDKGPAQTVSHKRT